MQEISADLWKEHAAGAVVAITTNGMVTRSGKSVLLQGCARQASIRYPDLAGTLGGLEWKDVQPILQTYFDDRFHVIRKD